MDEQIVVLADKLSNIRSIYRGLQDYCDSLMKILIDTNVILDVLCNRKEFVDDSSKVFKLCEVKKLTGYISALSIPNIVYIMRKELVEQKIKEIIEKLTLVFDIVDLKGEDLKKAVVLKFNDYEKVMAIKPAELLDRI